MLTNYEISEIQITRFISGEIVGDLLKAKYGVMHNKISEGYIIVNIPLNRLMFGDIRLFRPNIMTYDDKINNTLLVNGRASNKIRTVIDSECSFELSYKMKEVEKEMTLAEIEKALGYKVKIVN